MERKCSSCGARISDEMKICANCGKVVPPLRTNRPVNPNAQRRTENRTSNRVVTPQNVQRTRNQPVPERRQVRPAPQRQQVVHRERPQVKAPKTNRNNTKAKIFKGLKIALIVLIVYVVISAIQIFRVRLSTYHFKVDMKMSQENYGQAVDSFFDSGLWTYNPFTFTVTYKGEKKAEGDYELKFSAVTSVKLKSVSVDGKEKTGDKMESAIMGLFI